MLYIEATRLLTFFLNISKLLKIVSKSKFEFFKPTQRDILVFDKTNTFFVQKYLGENKSTLSTRNEKFNLYVLIANFIQGKFSKIEYINSFINFVNPKIIISTIDNNPFFYSLKTTKNQKKILVQTAWKSPVYDRSILKLTKNRITVVKKKNYSIDLIFVFNKYFGKLFKKLNSKKVIIIGSLKSNYYYKKNIKKNIDLLLISSWSNIDLNSKITSELKFFEYQRYQNLILKNLSTYIKKYKLKLYILGKHNNEQSSNEFNYFNNFFKEDNWKFLVNDNINSYKLVDKSEVILTFHSTLGYESLSRGNKTIFINPFNDEKSMASTKFGWPSKLKKNGPFWTTNVTYRGFETIVNRVRDMKNNEFKSLFSKYAKNLMPYDKNNKIFNAEFIKINKISK